MMKKLLFFVLMCLCGTMASFADQWTDAEGNTWNFTIKDSENKLVKLTGLASGTNATVPGSVYVGDVEYMVGSIGNNAFSHCSSLQSIGDLSACTCIEYDAFEYCSSLQSIGDLSACTSIGYYAFNNCSSLQSIGDLSACTSIGYYAFNNCSSLQSIGDLSVCTNIGNYAFKNCSCLQSIGDLSACTSIGEEAFCKCSSLQNIGDLSACTSIGSYAFTNCSSLQSIGDLSACTSIGSYAFTNCSSLQSIGDLSACTSIGTDAFKNCSSLRDIHVKSWALWLSNVTLREAITGCGSAKKYLIINGSSTIDVVFPDGTTSIPTNAFSQFVNIRSIVIPETVTIIGENAFPSFTNDVCRITINSETPATLAAVNSFNNDCVIYVPASVLDTYRNTENWQSHASQILAIGCKEEYDVTVEASTLLSSLHIALGENNLQNVTKLKVSGTINGYDLMLMRNKMTNLHELDLSDANIVADSYEYYTGYSSVDDTWTRYALPQDLYSLILPKTLKQINSYAMADMTNLKKLVIPANVVTIEANAANGNTVTDFDFSQDKALKSIGASAFSGCTKLKKVDLGGSALATLGSSVFGYCTALDSASFDNTNLSVLPSYTFYNTGLKSFNIPASITKVEEYALGYCYKLDTLTMADSETSLTLVSRRAYNGGYHSDYENVKYAYIGRDIEVSTNNDDYRGDDYRGFGSHTSLTKVEFGGHVTTVPYRMFYGCTALEEVTGMNLLDSISSYAFYNCPKLQSFDFNNNIKTIPEYAFKGCASLNAIYIPVNVTTLGQHAFDGCAAAKTCTLPVNSVIGSIPAYTFANCTSLEKVDLPTSVKKIEDYAFQNCTGMKEAKLPSAINKVGDYAFNGCSNLFDVYTYTIEPQAIDQNTFSQFSGATLHIPQVSWYNYYYNTQWSQFQKLVNFDEPYDYAYVENDYTLYTDQLGILQGSPEFDIWPGGTMLIQGNRQQPSRECHLRYKDGKWGSVIPKNPNFVPEQLYIDIDVNKDFWYAFSFPFNVDLTKVQKEGDWVFRRYDGSMRAANGSGGWQNVEGTTLKANTGYIFRTNKAGKLAIPISAPDFTPEDKDLTLEEHPSELGAQHAGWNFIGNPYTAYYSMNDMEYTAPIVVWNGTGYEAFRPGDDEHAFHPFEPFFVQRPHDVKDVNFRHDLRAGYNDMMLISEGSRVSASRASKAQRLNAGVTRLLINLTLSNGDATDKTRIVYNDKQKMDYEAECDASKFLSTAVGVQIYSIDDNGVRYAINERPKGDGSVMLGYFAKEAGEYTLSATRMDVPVIVRDYKENITFDLSEDDYTFTTDGGTFNGRFAIEIAEGETTAIDNVNAESNTNNDVIYDLNGRRMNKAGNGVNIINGKKVLK